VGLSMTNNLQLGKLVGTLGMMETWGEDP
jgi:hypothetical protein